MAKVDGKVGIEVSEKFSTGKFLGGGGGRLILCALAMLCVTFLIHSKSFTSDYHMGGVCIGFALLSGSVAGKEVLAGIKLIFGGKAEGNANASNTGPDKK